MIWKTFGGVDVGWLVLVGLDYDETVTEGDVRVGVDGLAVGGLGYDRPCTDGIELD